MHQPERDMIFDFNPRNKSVQVKAQRFMTEMKGRFTYRFLLMDIVGVAYSNASDVTMRIETGVGRQIDPRTGEWAPSLKVREVDIQVDTDKITIRLEGSLVAKIASLFTNLFKTEILGQIIE